MEETRRPCLSLARAARVGETGEMLIALVELPLHHIRDELPLRSIAKARCSEKLDVRKSALRLELKSTGLDRCLFRARPATADPPQLWLPEHL